MENEKGESCWYWGILTQAGDEWEDYEELQADLYRMPALPGRREDI